MTSENRKPKTEKKKSISGSGVSQLLRALLNTSVTWCLFIRMIHANIGSGRLPVYILFAVMFAIWVIVPNLLYRRYGAGKVIVYRIVMPAFYLLGFNVIMLLLIMVRMGTDSGFFRLCACLTIASAVVYLIDLFYNLVHFAGWAGSDRKASSDRKAKKQTIEPEEQGGAEWARLPEGILKEKSGVFIPLWIGGAILIMFAMTREINLFSAGAGTSFGSTVLFALLLVLCMMFIMLIMAAVAGFVQSKISNRKKYRVKHLNEGRKHPDDGKIKRE